MDVYLWRSFLLHLAKNLRVSWNVLQRYYDALSNKTGKGSVYARAAKFVKHSRTTFLAFAPPGCCLP